jgi:hypothetical protein
MAKLDKSQYSKQEWRKIKEERRKAKESKKSSTPNVRNLQKIADAYNLGPHTDNNEKRYVLCIKHGKKYGSEYVNILYNMVKKNLTLDFEMVCLTDDPTGIHPSVTTYPLPPDIGGWWVKPYMFSKELPVQGTILYMDLDVVIAGNIDKLFTYNPNNWCIIRDFTRAMRPKWQKYNSSVIRFKTGQLDHIWTDFIANYKSIMKRMHGDQDWIYERDTSAIFWPDSWILSWKWEVRKDKQLSPGLKGARKLKTVENVTPRIECCVCVFHGDPNPHNCDDPWVKENWQ